MSDTILGLLETFLRGIQESVLWGIALYPFLDTLDTLWRALKDSLLGIGDRNGKER